MPFFSIIAASALSVALNDVGTATHLQNAYHGSERGSVLFRAWVAPSGKILECEVLEVSVDERLRSTFCPIYQRQRITPARGPDGKPTYSLIESINIFDPGSVNDLKLPADATFTANDLPDGAPEYRIFATLVVDERGKVSECETSRKASQTYAKLLCAAVAERRMEVKYDEAGQAVQYVTGFWGSFRPSAGG
ncbi:MAG TPA: hypothetical protein VF418_10220 [Sphingomonadaceae bacterium]